jgi:hypothetical protein
MDKDSMLIKSLQDQITFMETVIDDLARDNKLMKSELRVARAVISDAYEQVCREPY